MRTIVSPAGADITYDLAVIGGGPAGLSAAIYALRAGKSVLIFEGNALGGTLNGVDRIENYPGFKSVSGQQLGAAMTEQALALGPVVIKQFVKSVAGQDGAFTLVTAADAFFARKIIYAGGVKRGTLAAAKNFSGSGVSYCAVCDGFFYKGKTVAVVGGGYAAQHDAEYLSNICKKVYLIGDAKAKGAHHTQDSVLRLLGGETLTGVELKSGKTLEIDGLFIALGGAAASEIFSGVIPEGKSALKEGFIAPGIYIAGDAGADFKQIVWACASGAKAATVIFKSVT